MKCTYLKAMRLFLLLALVSTSAFAQFKQVDLRKYCNMGFKDDVEDDQKGGWIDKGINDMRNIPTGRQVFKGVPFDVINPEKNNGKSCVVLFGNPRPYFIVKTNILVNDYANYLYFLHTCAWGAREPIARYEIVYKGKDAPEQVIQVVLGDNIGGFWNTRDGERSGVAWEGANPKHKPVGVSMFAWENPYPGEKILGIRIVSERTSAVPILLGITLSAEDKPVPLGKQTEERKVERKAPRLSRFLTMKFVPDNPGNKGLDFSFLLDAPAGKHGPLMSREGDFVFSDGTPARFWGVNTSLAWDPSKTEAEQNAERLSRFGINLVRYHPLDTGIMDNSLSAKGFGKVKVDWDKFDYQFYQFKKRGIYVKWSSLYNSKAFAEDGVQQADQINQARLNKVMYFFDPTLQQLYFKFLTTIFTHVNPYTGVSYADDPALAFTQAVAKNNIFFYQTDAIPPYYREQLRRGFNEFLKSKYGSTDTLRSQYGSALKTYENLEGSTVDLLPIWQMTSVPNKKAVPGEFMRVRDQVTYYMFVQSTFYRKVENHLRQIGYKGMFSGSAHYAPGVLQQADLVSQAEFGFVDRYYEVDSAGSSTWDIAKSGTTLYPLSQKPWMDEGLPLKMKNIVLNRPLMLSEFSQPLPIDWVPETVPIVAAYGRMQGLDAAAIYEWRTSSYTGLINDRYNISAHPGLWGMMPLGSVIMVRGDVSEAPIVFSKIVSRQAVANNFDALDEYPGGSVSRATMAENPEDALLEQELGENEVNPYFAIGRGGIFFNPSATTVINNSQPLNNKLLSKQWDKDNTIIYSITGEGDHPELSLNYGRGFVKIDTPKTQGASGFLDSIELDFRDVRIKVLDTEFLSVFVTTMDDSDKKDIGKGDTLLVMTVPRAYNTGMTYNNETLVVEEIGEAPTLVEKVYAELRFKGRGKRQTTVWPLDCNGNKIMDRGSYVVWEDKFIEDNDFIMRIGRINEPYLYYLIKFGEIGATFER